MDEERRRKEIQTALLRDVPMAGSREAGRLLGLSDPDPSAALDRLEAEGRLLRYTRAGEPVYPLFQFDAAGSRVHPIMEDLLAMRSEDWGGPFAFLNWLVTPSRSLGDARPSESLAGHPERVRRAFHAEVTEHFHG